ncbi:CoxG family protein [Bacillus gaemokensis]|uniref:Carbon monoxide dehydrogenase n=1 Tax=Bacillus gaemokensis TaxID=574375 RepID=A0A073KGA8_9BACI|nr:SRPBCC family protein [Bacillus gaemokensis]KEK25447.1 hypothetical protein BAGA_12590 [Bacillus gaemokensis]KYG37108.1 hypothetical protein AZF08_06785 [Bacillus gaemokensis]
MAKGTNLMELQVPLDHTWNFISDINNWAPLITGYVAHKIIDDRHSTWRLHGDLGVVKRYINLNVKITEWQEHDKISFTIASPTNKLVGSGFFHAKAIDSSKTRITSELELKATGKGAFIFNGAMKPFVPKMTRRLTEAIANNLVGNYR